MCNFQPTSNLLYSLSVCQAETKLHIRTRCVVNPYFTVNRPTRREILKAAGALAGGCALSQLSPKALAGATTLLKGQGSAAPADALLAARARFGKVPIEATKLSDNLTLLRGP